MGVPCFWQVPSPWADCPIAGGRPSRAASGQWSAITKGDPGDGRRCLICGGSSQVRLRAGPGLCGRRRMSGIKKTQSLGHCPIRSTDLRRSPGLSLVAASLSLCHACLSFALFTFPYQYVGWGWGWNRGWTWPWPWDSTWTLTWTFLSSVKHPRSARSAALLAPCHPSPAAGHGFNGASCLCAGWHLGECSNKKNPGLPGSQVEKAPGSLEPTRHRLQKSWR